jgi:hypothetical protein
MVWEYGDEQQEASKQVWDVTRVMKWGGGYRGLISKAEAGRRPSVQGGGGWCWR